MAAKKAAKKAGTSERTPHFEVYDAVEQGAKRTVRFVRKHPWESVGIAALTGAVIARLLFRRR